MFKKLTQSFGALLRAMENLIDYLVVVYAVSMVYLIVLTGMLELYRWVSQRFSGDAVWIIMLTSVLVGGRLLWRWALYSQRLTK